MKTGFRCALFGAGLLCAGVAQAQGCEDYFADQRFTLLVPHSAGGGFDAYARAFAPAFEEATGATMVVNNLTAANGAVAMARIVEASAEDRVIGMSSIGVPVEIPDFDPMSVTPVVSLYSDVTAWVTAADTELDALWDKGIIAGGDTLVQALPNLGLVAKALDVEMSIVTGYDGSSAVNAAILRDEIDLDARSAGSAQRAEEGGDLKLAMTLTTSPVPGTDAPAFGEIFAARLDGATEEERTQRQFYADIVAGLSLSMRTLFVSHAITGEDLACIVDTLDEVANSEAFRTAAEAVKRPVEVSSHEESKARYTDFVRATQASQSVLEAIRPEFE
ncbi:MAG: hypothetical protein AAFX45_07825 [Pseudomonadota bacterium]